VDPAVAVGSSLELDLLKKKVKKVKSDLNAQ
jgi:hypothetical protein